MPPANSTPVAENPPEEESRKPAVIRTPDKQAQPKTRERPAAIALGLTLISSPSGATATLDGHPDVTCVTPCYLDAQPGRHTIAFTLPGYEVERREVEVGSGPIELPAVILRAPVGTLMLSSDPPGASILVNGKKRSEITPAVIALAPGSYKITVEKDGKQNTQPVEMQNGIVTLKLPLGQ
jgi:serine/threonine-protein kinase